MNIITRLIAIGSIFLITASFQSIKVDSSPQIESIFYTDSIYSDYLSEYRKHNIYLPIGYNSIHKYPIIYATDGFEINELNFYKNKFDSLINNKITKPFVFIASHANIKIADSTRMTMGNGDKVHLPFRNFEYVANTFGGNEEAALKDRFKNHMAYFKDELIPKVEKKLHQNLSKEDRYFYGVSNGAGFGLSLLNAYPNVIETYICFSTFGGDIQSNKWKKGVAYPKLYMQYGSEEPPFLKADADFLKTKYKKLKLFAEIVEYKGGHDHLIWDRKFTEIISELLSVK